MNGWIATFTAFVLMLAAGSGGALLARRLPEEYLSEHAMKNLRIGMALVGTMSSLLLGLMINSSRYNFSEAYSDVQKYTAAVQLTDLELLQYGESGCRIRSTLHDYATKLVEGTWGGGKGSSVREADPSLSALLRLHGEIRALEASNEDQKLVRSTLLSLSRQLMEYHWKVDGEALAATPITFLAVVISWFCIIFWFLGVFAPRNNPVVAVGQVLAMTAIAGAIFLVNEMGEPFSGPIQVSSESLARLLDRMDAEPCPSRSATPTPASPAGR